MQYDLIAELAGAFPVEVLCSVLGLSRSAYYRYQRGASYQQSTTKQRQQQLVEQVFTEHKRRYGSRRIVAELQQQGHQMGRHRVRSLMKLSDLQPIQPKSFVPRTTDSTHGKGFWPNLLLNQPLPQAPDRVWISDITYLPLVSGEWAYLGGWLDLFSRRVVGWRVDDNMEESLVRLPLQAALASRQPLPGLILHSGRGGQYVSTEIRKVIDLWRIRPSMSRADNPYDNAFAESFWSRLKAELLEGGAFLSVEDARTEIFDYIELYTIGCDGTRRWATKALTNLSNSITQTSQV